MLEALANHHWLPAYFGLCEACQLQCHHFWTAWYFSTHAACLSYVMEVTQCVYLLLVKAVTEVQI